MPDTDYDTWVVCRHRFPTSGQSAVITVNTTLEKRLKFADYPYHVSIAIDAAAHSVDPSGRIGAHESQHLLVLSRVIREALECEDQHLMAIVHGVGARTLELHARDGEAVARRLKALKDEKTWDRAWGFEVEYDPKGKRSKAWREIAAASQEHHLAVNIPHSRGGESADHHHHLF
ncbi:MAG: DUF695 domain-containing protein [Steroidobacteraceae bacterium]